MKKRKKKKKIRWFRFLFEVFVLLVLAAGLFVAAKFAQIQTGGLNRENVAKNGGISGGEQEIMSGYRNLALFGVDSREGDLQSGTNSDTIMICSINETTHEVRIVSIYRDTYLEVGDGLYSKCNAAYAAGGAEQAVRMLNKNLDMDITDYVTVNFEALADLVDLAGGIDVTLTEGEVGYLNDYLVEGRAVLGRECEDVPGPGLQHLNGMQALAYSRIRYIGLDFERTKRQRTVLEQVFEKLRASDILTLNRAIDTLLPNVSTSLSVPEIVLLASGAAKYSMGDTQGFPFDKEMADLQAGSCVVPADLSANVSQLHAFLFGTQDYAPSAEVQQISAHISQETGI